MMREFVNKLRMVADNIEANLNELDSILSKIPVDEQGLGKTLVQLSGDYPSKSEFIDKWVVPYRWTPANKKQEEGRMKRKYTKLYPHWTQRPENKAKVARAVKKMLSAKNK